MPSSITHELIAGEALELLPLGAREAVACAPDYFYLGAQGPDLYFFYRPLKRKAENFGKLLHRSEIYGWCSALLSKLTDFTGRDFERCLAYALGYCSHVAADVVFHPFVYNYLREEDVGSRTHQRIESDWDVYFLRALKRKSPLRYEFPFDLKEIAADGVLYRYLSTCANDAGHTLSEGAFRRMLSNFDLYLAHFHRKHGRILRAFGLAALYPRETPDPDFLYGEKFEALAEGKGRNADELFLHAVQETASCITAFLEAFNGGGELPRPLFSRHLLTGKGI